MFGLVATLQDVPFHRSISVTLCGACPWGMTCVVPTAQAPFAEVTSTAANSFAFCPTLSLATMCHPDAPGVRSAWWPATAGAATETSAAATRAVRLIVARGFIRGGPPARGTMSDVVR